MVGASQPAANSLCRPHCARLPSTPQHVVPLRAPSRGNASNSCLSSRCRQAYSSGRPRVGAEEVSGEASLEDADARSVGRRPILTVFPISTAVAAAAALVPLARPVSAQEEAALQLDEGPIRDSPEAGAPQTSEAAADAPATAEEVPSSSASSGLEPSITSRVYLDVSIEGAPAGRIVIGLYGKVTRIW